VDGIEFHLKRNIRDGYVFKTVEFETSGQQFRFQEKVRMFTLTDFQALFVDSGLTLCHIYGGYDLSHFDAATSTRLILIAQKPSMA
jgi:hypothetical protein